MVSNTKDVQLYPLNNTTDSKPRHESKRDSPLTRYQKYNDNMMKPNQQTPLYNKKIKDVVNYGKVKRLHRE